jgi:CDK-activating kinase assembly factor MAT1
MIESLAAGGDAEQIVREGQRAILKKARNRQALLDSQRFDDSGLSGAETSSAFNFKLKQKPKVEPEAPFDPFSGMKEEHEYYVLQDSYPYEWTNRLQDTPNEYPDILAGGYDVREYYARALCEAFSGLGVFVADEKSKDEEASEEVATEAAAAAAVDKVDVMMDDVFG